MNRLKKILFERHSLIFVLLSVIFPFVLITPQYFPSTGISILFISLATLAFLLKKQERMYETFLYVSILIFSFFLIFRANDFLFLLNTLTILYLGSFLISHQQPTKIIQLIFSPLIVFIRTLVTPNTFEYRFKRKNKSKQEINYEQHLPGIILSGVIILITIPLLSYANPYFAEIVKSILHLFDIDVLLKKIFGENILVYLFRLLIFLIFIYYLPKFSSFIAQDEKNQSASRSLPINFLIPKIVLSFILFLFFITQIQLYTASAQTLERMGYTNSQYAREVFAQLSIVAFITFLLLFGDPSKAKNSRFLTYMLIIESFFLCGVGLKSVFDYTTNWGFTQKRLYGYSEVFWILGALLIFLYYFKNNIEKSKFVRLLTGYSIFILLLINITNFDYIIYHYAKSRTGNGDDYLYLSELSTDAHAYKNHLTLTMNAVKKEPTYEKTWPAHVVLHKIEDLQKKYKTIPPIGSFNISEYLEYRDIKDIPTEVYNTQLSKMEEKLRQLIYPTQPTVIPVEPVTEYPQSIRPQ